MKKQRTMDVFYGFTDSIIVQTEKSYSQLGNTSINNALCTGDIDLMKSKTLQENTNPRNKLQGTVSEVSSFAEGKGIVQIRR